MTNLTETDQWETGIRRIETTDQVLGGETGPMNAGIKQLCNRTLQLRKYAAREAALNHWRPSSNAKTTKLNAIACHELTGLMAVGDTDAGDAYIILSKDHGNTWSEIANPKNLALRGIGTNSGAPSPFGANGIITIAVGDPDTDAYILRHDGTSFTEIANPKAFRLNAVLCVDPTNNIWVAVGAADGTDAYMLRSTNGGTSWTEIANPLNKNLNGLAIGAGRIVAVGDTNGTSPYVIYSDDLGLTWTQATLGGTIVSENLLGVAYGNGRWWAIGAAAYYSANGSLFTRVNGSIAKDAVAYSDGVFVGAGGGSLVSALNGFGVVDLTMSTSTLRRAFANTASGYAPKFHGICADRLGGFVTVGDAKWDATGTLVPGTNVWRSNSLPYEAGL